MSEHTPGPWRAYKIPGGVHCVRRVEPLLGPDGGAILWSRVRPMGDEVDAANASLIAAAPDLLDALKAAEGHLLETPD